MFLDLVRLQVVRNQPLRHMEQTIMRITTQRSNPADFSPKDDATKVITVNTLTLCRVRELITTRRCHRKSVEAVGTIPLQIIIILPGGIKNNPVNSLLKENADLELTAKIRMTLILLLHRRVLAVFPMVLQAQVSVIIDNGKRKVLQNLRI